MDDAIQRLQPPNDRGSQYYGDGFRLAPFIVALATDSLACLRAGGRAAGRGMNRHTCIALRSSPVYLRLRRSGRNYRRLAETIVAD